MLYIKQKRIKSFHEKIEDTDEISVFRFVNPIGIKTISNQIVT